MLLSLLNTVSAAAVPNLPLVAFWMPFAIKTYSAVRPTGQPSNPTRNLSRIDSIQTVSSSQGGLVGAERRQVLVEQWSGPTSGMSAQQSGYWPPAPGALDSAGVGTLDQIGKWTQHWRQVTSMLILGETTPSLASGTSLG